MRLTFSLPLVSKNINRYLLVGSGFLLLVLIFYGIIPVSYDWHTFHDAALELVSGVSPYGQEYYNPPWALLPLIPFALLPLRIGSAIISALAVFSFGYLAHRLGAKPVAIALFLLSPPIILEARSANITWLAALGFLMPPQIGLFFVSMKPQLGIGISIFWMVESWRDGGWRQVLRVFAPISLALGLSLLIFGFWPVWIQDPSILVSNSSLWPQSIPIGLVLLVRALWRRQRGLAISSSPFLSPYLSMHTWSVAMLGLLPHNLEFVTAVLGMWLWIVVKAI